MTPLYYLDVKHLKVFIDFSKKLCYNLIVKKKGDGNYDYLQRIHQEDH